jgi:hypothetical protein
MSTITCRNCNAQALEGAAFCDNCGAPISAAICPNCLHSVRPDDYFCDYCGQALREPVPPADEPLVVSYADIGPDEALTGPSAPRLLVLPAGNVLALAPGQDAYVIGRVDPASGSYPDVDLVPFGGEEGGVSRRHAQITRTDDRFYIEDLNSVNYTFVNKHKIAIGVAHPLEDGDEIRLGRVLLRFRSG